MYPIDIAKSIDVLEKHGIDIDIDKLFSRIGGESICKNLDALLDNGLAYWVVSNLHQNPYAIITNIDKLKKHGAYIDINNLASQLSPITVVENLGELIKHGANIDLKKLRSEIHEDDNLSNEFRRRNNGWTISEAYPDYIFRNLEILIEGDKDIDELVSFLRPRQIVEKLDVLLSNGASADLLLRQMGDYFDYGPQGLPAILSTFKKHGADVKSVLYSAQRMSNAKIVENLDSFIEYGKNDDYLMSELIFRVVDSKDTIDAFMAHGITINYIAARMNPDAVAYNLNILRKYGAIIDINDLIPSLSPHLKTIFQNALKRHSADN